MQIDQIRDDIQSTGGTPSGRVVLGLVPTVSCVISARLARRTVERYPGIWTKSPSLIAAILHRDFVRGRDDVTVLVAKTA